MFHPNGVEGNSHLTGASVQEGSERFSSLTAQRQKTAEWFERTVKEWETKRPFQRPAVGIDGGAESSLATRLT